MPSTLPDDLSDATIPAAKVHQWRRQRLHQVLWILIVAFAALAVASATHHAWAAVALHLCAAAVLALGVHWSRRGHPQLATAALLGAPTVALLALASEGLYDATLLALPALLVFAGLFGSRRLLALLLVCMLAALALLYGMHLRGILPSTAAPLGPHRIVLMSAMLVVTAFFVWLLVADLGRALEQIETDRQALIGSHARIELLAHRDSLTQLPNRTLAKDRLGHLLEHAQRSGTQVAVVLLDLDTFGQVNERLGHDEGDSLLVQLAQRLRTSMRASDTVARFSGDEFLITAGDLQGNGAVTSLLTKLLQALEQPFATQEQPLQLTASIGIAVAPRDGNDTDTLLRHADLAMQHAKAAGGDTLHFFAPGMDEQARQRLEHTQRLRKALVDDALQLHYLPQVALGRTRVAAAQARILWQDSRLGAQWLDADAPLVASSGLVDMLGTWALRRACQDARAWRAQGLEDVAVSAPVSALQFRHGAIERQVAEALAAAQLPASALILELAEPQNGTEVAQLAAPLQRLAASGVRIVIRRFGSGAASPLWLDHLSAAALELDAPLVRSSDAAHARTLQTLAAVARSLQLPVSAGGVDDAAALQRMQALGCSAGSGSYWTEPLAPAQLVAWVRQHEAHAESVNTL
ncbi:hypothetical protein GCM10022279_13300 [Comamonas faecalis]|uniref:EAL domain-containing protein n=1 Tax=Comamonas faecalis TaxID=1387849 RepID=A0ABP7R284_9BURK